MIVKQNQTLNLETQRSKSCTHGRKAVSCREIKENNFTSVKLKRYVTKTTAIAVLNSPTKSHTYTQKSSHVLRKKNRSRRKRTTWKQILVSMWALLMLLTVKQMNNSLHAYIHTCKHCISHAQCNANTLTNTCMLRCRRVFNVFVPQQAQSQRTQPTHTQEKSAITSLWFYVINCCEYLARTQTYQ